MTPERAQELPAALRGRSIPDVLLPYQQRVLATVAQNALTVVEKSRRIGVTWAIAADAVLTSAADRAAGGMDTWYIGYEKDMTREFIDTCAMWARSFNQIAGEVEEFVFRDGEGEDGRDIQAFRIRFASGFDITALCSRPRALRGKQGFVVVDEAAFHDDLGELLKAALALLIWGGRVLVISTHDGVENPFNTLVEDIRAGHQKGALLTITFDDALRDGLYKRICLVQGKEWSPEAEAEWAAEIRGIYRANAAEELDVIPKRSGGTFFPRGLIEARMSSEIPVLRWAEDADFVNKPEAETRAIAEAWCRANLDPLLGKLDPKLFSFFGQDFGRTGDLSVLWPVQRGRDMVLRTPFVVELRNIPFEEQKVVVHWILDRLPLFAFAALDATGNGASHAESCRRKYGEHRVEEVKFSVEWYRVNMPKLKERFEGASIEVPVDPDHRLDFEAVKMDRGIAKVPENARYDGSDGKQRHGDAAIACALASYAADRPIAEYGYEPVRKGGSGRNFMRPSSDDDAGERLANMQGAW